MNWIWVWKLTGGRPMKYVGHNFVDVVDGRDVNNYEDRLGRRWMANHGWSRFRVSLDAATRSGVSSPDDNH